jgi:hypothetical protein
LEDVGQGGGVQMAGVEEAEEAEDMTAVKGMNNDVRKEKREHHYNAGYMRLNWVWIKGATK